MDSKPEQDPVPQRKSSRWPWIVAILLAISGGVVAFVTLQPRGPEAPLEVDAGVALVEDAGPTVSLDEGDALLKKLAAGWSRDATFAKWLDALVVRQLAAATQAVAEGSSPKASLPFISLNAPFSVREEEVAAPPHTKKKPRPPPPPPRAFIAAESYARYDEITEVFASIDAAAAGELFGKLEPYCEAAFSEISRPGTHFHEALVLAVKRLVGVTVPEGEVELVPKGAVYAFKDPALESLSAAEKHLVRMGPKNAQRIQAQLRIFAEHAKLDLR